MTELILIRGLPGSGKSTKAKEIIINNRNLDIRHIEADMYFIDNGEYIFDREKLKDAHDWCFSCATLYLVNDSNVIVSNTFTQYWEMELYINLANELKIDYTIIEMLGDFGNIHGVPDDTLIRMKERYQPNALEYFKQKESK